MLRTPAPAGERQQLWDVAYGFMASKALFAALELDLFTELANGPRTCTELSASTGVAGNRLQTLLHALTGLGLTSSYAADILPGRVMYEISGIDELELQIRRPRSQDFAAGRHPHKPPWQSPNVFVGAEDQSSAR